MVTIQDKNKKTTGRVDSSGDLDNNTLNGPMDRIHDGRTCDPEGNFAGRYQGGKSYDDRGPWGGKATGHYEKGKIYDMDGHWGGKETGRHSESVSDKDNGCDRYRLSSGSRSSTPPDGDHSRVSYPQQDRGSRANLEKKGSRTLVQPQIRQGRGISFLMSTCRHCGSPAKGKYYKLLLILTPFALLFYALICSIVISIAFTNQNSYHFLVNMIASILTISIFLMPGLAVLYVLKRPKGVCGACSQRLYYQSLEANQRPGGQV